ncbi:hypothetical protein L3X38_002514 [Prunus dulcis]|uniref:Uncharacterized protein n=1 Tax=Prunus dulcis TaxID=3755 RepID=A0AAD4WU32_PRUDU|nr:hypothetical protein L3X38_002514 [Prunus dulcis]
MWRLPIPRKLMKVAGEKISQHKTRMASVKTSYPKALMRVASKGDPIVGNVLLVNIYVCNKALRASGGPIRAQGGAPPFA